MECVPFEILKGKILQSINKIINFDGNDELHFKISDDEIYKMYHRQDCCENVNIEDICGDLDDLIGSEILIAREDTESDESEDGDSTWTWTFYNLSTIKSSVTIRWYGSSNGYYSESVELYRC